MWGVGVANSYFHAQSTARKFGGTPEDFLPIHEFLDGSKVTFPDVRHRALLHNSWGIWMAQEVFGRVIEIEKAGGGTKKIPVREIAENHIIEDLGFIPEVGDWLRDMPIKVWMGGKQHRVLARGEFLDKTVKEGK
jgi:hypothetical protein